MSDSKVDAHYATMKVQPFDVIDTWPVEQRIGFYRGNLLKYTMRIGTKGQDVTDAKKAEQYAEKLTAALAQRGRVGTYDV